MRYFSQLARETKARVIPARQPAWLPPIAQVMQEGVPEWPAEASASRVDSKSGQSARAPELSADRPVRNRESADKNAEMNPAPRPFPLQAEWKTEESRERVMVEKHFHQELALTLQARNSAGMPEPISVAPLESPDRHEVENSKTIAMPQRVESITPVGQQMKPATLQDAISEITRRQDEFERNYRAKGTLSEVGSLPDTLRAEVRPEPETEVVSLDIGSIVVQVAPEPPAVKAPPRPAAKRPSQENDYRWQRSFLDRY